MFSRTGSDLVAIGELLWDCFPGRRSPGGAPANVAYHAQRLGLRAFLGTRVGDDADGRELLGFLDERGLDTTLIQVDRSHPTGTVIVHADDPSRPSYEITADVAWDHIATTDALCAAVRRTAAICVGTLAQRSPVSRATVDACLEAAASALVVFDVNLRPPHYDRECIERTLNRTDILKLNLDEARELAGMLGGLPAEPAAFAGALLQRRPRLRLVCLTRAEEGCILVTREASHDLPGVPAQVEDAVGAGDAFTAALVLATLRDWPAGLSGEFANRVGALVASSRGAMPEIGDRLRSLVQDTEVRARSREDA